MNEGDALDILRSAIWMVVVGAGPTTGAAMAVGVLIAVMQALTQIQEATLTFVPKIVVVFLVGGLTATFVGGRMKVFTEGLYSRIEHGFDK